MISSKYGAPKSKFKKTKKIFFLLLHSDSHIIHIKDKTRVLMLMLMLMLCMICFCTSYSYNYIYSYRRRCVPTSSKSTSKSSLLSATPFQNPGPFGFMEEAMSKSGMLPSPEDESKQIYFGVLTKPSSAKLSPEVAANLRASAASTLTNIDQPERDRRTSAGTASLFLAAVLSTVLLGNDSEDGLIPHLFHFVASLPLFLAGYSFRESGKAGL